MPKTKHTQCIDMMVKVLSDPKLHLQAAEGYKSTGWTVELDGSEDHKIVREAGEFFRGLNMREKIKREVAIVEEEYKAGRLKWTYEDVYRLIQPYPARRGDDVLAAIGEHTSLDDDDTPYETAPDACGEDEPDSAVAEDSEPEEVEEIDVESSEGEHASAVADVDMDVCEHDSVVEEVSVAVAGPALNEAQAEQVHNSQFLVAAYEQSIEVLKQCGAMPMAALLQNEIKKEMRRQRISSNEEPAVAAALADFKAARAADQRQQRLAIIDINRREKERAELAKATEKAKAALSKKKRELMSLEGVLESRHALKRYTPEALGQGKARSGGVAARNLRNDVLERMAVLGTGLSPAQRNDWKWFRGA